MQYRRALRAQQKLDLDSFQYQSLWRVAALKTTKADSEGRQRRQTMPFQADI